MEQPLRLRLALALAGPYAARLQAGTVSSRVDDGPGWRSLSGRPHERDAAEIEELYDDALAAWRKNPLAKRAVDIIADYVVGDGITLTSPFPPLQRFIDDFWHHPRNQLPHRLETMCNELALAGDLFPLLFHWAARAFLWFVRVPAHLVGAKQEQYRQPPEPGSIVISDDAEEWEVKAPRLNAADASHDLEAVRRMVFTGSGIPPHWFGERGSNRAEASAMQEPAERHLRRRQHYFVWLLEDIVYHAYERARVVRPEMAALPPGGYRQLFTAAVPDISRRDSGERALAASHLAAVWRDLMRETEPQSRRLAELLLAQIFRFMGEPQDAAVVKGVVEEMFGR